jgi:hypothetical protein
MVEPGIIGTAMTMRPRPAPPPGEYSSQRKRFAAMFIASLETPESPFVVADTILSAVEGRDTRSTAT